MALGFENLAKDVEKMAAHVARRAQARQETVARAIDLMRSIGTDWTRIESAVYPAETRASETAAPVRTAKPLHEDAIALHQGIVPATPPTEATIMAIDGSQIMPDRHAPYLYYLLNVGGLVFYHGSNEPPREMNSHQLAFDDDDLIDDSGFMVSGATVSARRDELEIGQLARLAHEEFERGTHSLRIAVLDQRLLYRPVGQIERKERDRISVEWQENMNFIHQRETHLVGYVDRPRTTSVVSMLGLVENAELGNDVDTPNPFGGIVDVEIFHRLLQPGERSKLFVTLSKENDSYKQRHPNNEVCFFYFNATSNPTSQNQIIARVDLPISTANDPEAVADVHAMLYDQCRIWRDYPYVLTRADEIAVVGRQDQANLDVMIANAMLRLGVDATSTAKQTGKDIARAGKTRFAGP